MDGCIEGLNFYHDIAVMDVQGSSISELQGARTVSLLSGFIYHSFEFFAVNLFLKRQVGMVF